MANKRKSSRDGQKKNRHSDATKGRSHSRSSGKRGSSVHRDESTLPFTSERSEGQAHRFGSSIATADFHDDQDDFVDEEENEEDDIV